LIICSVLTLSFIIGCKESATDLNVNKKATQTENVGSKEIRESYIKFLNKQASKLDTNSKFTLDENDSTTLCLHRKTKLRPEDVGGNEQWIFLISTLTENMDISEIKSKGFNKVRIYTLTSKDISDYSLRIIP
jgi:hypothetical protein